MTETASPPAFAETPPAPTCDRPTIVAYGVAVCLAVLAALAFAFPSPALSAVLAAAVVVAAFASAGLLARERRTNRQLVVERDVLAKDAARLEAFLHNARDGIHILDTEGRIVDASDSFCRMLGYERTEVEGMHVSGWDAQVPAGRLATFIPELFARSETTTFETRHRRKDGSVFDVEISGCPIDMNGRRVLFHSSRDITDRKALEARYHEIYASVLSAGESTAWS